MTLRKNTPQHDFWHRRVEGQIRDCMHHHPEWFNVKNENHKKYVVNSLAKRIVGEIIAVGGAVDRKKEVIGEFPLPITPRVNAFGRLLKALGI